MNVLLLGSGGREHALSWKLAQSPLLSQLFIAPGNAGTGQHGTNVQLDPLDFDRLGTFCLENEIALVVVGPEEPLVRGLSDYFSGSDKLRHIPVIGPSQKGAELEGSKDFAKAFMMRHNIPTARYRSFGRTELQQAREFLGEFKPPYVLKASGLAAGKGVVILEDRADAERELEEMFSGKFGAAGDTVVIEEFLDGIEFSVFILTDGRDFLLLPEAKDYKRIGEKDTGLNTGGMGAVSPVPFCTDEVMDKVQTRIIEPTLRGLQEENISYLGFIFFGLILVNGDPQVIEYNVRMGDPETEVVIPRLNGDLLEGLVAASQGKINSVSWPHRSGYATTVMAVSGGYPGSYEKGKVIKGLGNAPVEPYAVIFHAGTTEKEGNVVTAGGRVLASTCLGEGLKETLQASYERLEHISFEGMYYRRDIGQDLLRLL